PNTDQGPVARLVGRYAVRLIRRIHRARPTIFGRNPLQQLRGIADLMTRRTGTVPLDGSRRIRIPCADRPMRMESPIAAASLRARGWRPSPTASTISGAR